MIDSICKAVGVQYVSWFAKKILRSFVNAYHQSSDNEKMGFKKVLATWKTIFHPQLIKDIENRLANPSLIIPDSEKVEEINSSSKGYSHSAKSLSSRSTSIELPVVELPVSIDIPEIKYVENPPQGSEVPLEKKAGISRAKEYGIFNRNVKRPVVEKPKPSEPPVEIKEKYPANVSMNNHPVEIPIEIASFLTSMNSKRPIEKEAETPKRKVKKLEKKDMQIEETIFDFNEIVLEYSVLKKQYKNSDDILYSNMSLQCKTCGFRFSNNEKGKTTMGLHLDAHFRKNRRLREKTRKAMSRDWFVTEDKWVNQETQNELFEKQFTHSFFESAADETIQSVQEDHFVAIQDGVVDRKCPVCREMLTSFWDKEKDEWMFKNAVCYQNEIYHKNCYDDLRKNKIEN